MNHGIHTGLATLQDHGNTILAAIGVSALFVAFSMFRASTAPEAVIGSLTTLGVMLVTIATVQAAMERRK